VVRTTPTIMPRISAITHADSAVARVQPSPAMRVSRYVPRPSGESCQKMPQFQLYFTAQPPTGRTRRARACDYL